MRWMWIDRIIELVPRQRLVAVKSVSLSENYLHEHFPAGPGHAAIPVMPGPLIIEGMAQTAGILVGHAEEFREKVILAKVGLAELDAEATPGTTLRYTATIRQMDRQGASADGTVELIEPGVEGASPLRIGRIELMFSHIDRNMAGQKFPEHNFVFGESFRTLLRLSGVG